MRCKAGDLAVVVNAQCRCNLGNIVRIVAPHDGAGILRFPRHGHVWIVASHRPMTWYLHGKRYRRKTGPVPDCRLQPIRGLPPGTSWASRPNRTRAWKITPGKGFACSRSEPVAYNSAHASLIPFRSPSGASAPASSTYRTVRAPPSSSASRSS